MVCIITYARSWQALIAVRALGKAGIKVITADTDKYATSFFSRYSKGNFLYTSPDVDEKKFVQDLIKRCKQYRKKYKEDVMILPIHKETYIISKYKDKLSRYAKLCVEDHKKIMRVHNKSALPDILKKHNITHPRTFKIRDTTELYKLTPKLKFPVFLKLPEAASAVGLVKVDERDRLIYEYNRLIKRYHLKPKNFPIIQEGVKGKDYCVTAILNKGKLRAMMTYISIRTYPHKAGASAYRKNVSIPAMDKQAKKLLSKIKWHGPIEIDFRMGPDKIPYLIEVNPRFWGGLNQSVASNVNYPMLAYNIAVNGDCETVKKINKDVRTENLPMALMSLMEEIKQNKAKQKEIAKLRNYWKKAFSGRKDFSKYMNLFFKHFVKMKKKRYTRRTIEEFIYRRKRIAKDDILDSKDPFAVFGILYPIHLMLKHGKIDTAMLTGEMSEKKK
ncbi:ATP-grasp domain-containing protein [Thermoproteota archaeon]